MQFNAERLERRWSPGASGDPQTLSSEQRTALPTEVIAGGATDLWFPSPAAFNPDPGGDRLNRFEREWHPGVSQGSTAGFERVNSPRDDAPCQQARQALLELESANCQVLASLAMSGIM